jgi:nucleotide-binding universal stress UspA family protein
MIEIKRILLPTDFSDTSKEALKYAISMAREFGAEMTALHVINQQLLTEGLNLPRVISLQDLEKEMAREAERQMEAFLKDIPELGEVTFRTLIRLGNPFLEIINYARDNAVDLIVIGTHGRSGLEHIIFGSTAEKVVRKAPCPVLSVKPAQREFVVPS